MRALDLLKIKNAGGDGFELFEAIADDITIGTSENPTNIQIQQPFEVQLVKEPSEQPGDAPDPELTPLWNAQSTVIVEQNERLDLLYNDLENKRQNLEGYDFDWGEILLEGLLETGVEWIIKKLLLIKRSADYVLPAALEFLIDWSIEIIPNAVSFLIEKYRQARSEIGAMKTENNELLALQKSWDNYHLRLEILRHHEEAIENLLHEIIEHEKPLNMVSQDYSAILEKIENSLSGRAEEGEDEELVDFWVGIEDALEKIIAPTEENGEDEESPQLPALPPKYPAGTMTRFLHTLLKMEGYKMQELVKLNQNLELLQFNGQRLHLPNGDIVELTGIGTVTASPDQF